MIVVQFIPRTVPVVLFGFERVTEIERRITIRPLIGCSSDGPVQKYESKGVLYPITERNKTRLVHPQFPELMQDPDKSKAMFYGYSMILLVALFTSSMFTLMVVQRGGILWHYLLHPPHVDLFSFDLLSTSAYFDETLCQGQRCCVHDHI